MKIGMILDNTFPPDPRVENEAGELTSQGFEVCLFCIAFTKDKPAQESYNNINVFRKSYPPVVRRLAALAYTNTAYHGILKIEIRKFLTDNKIDAIHVHDMQIARAVFQVNKNLKLPIILDLHENRPEIMKLYAHVRSFPGNLLIHPKTWEKYERKYIRGSDKTIVVTEEAKQYYMNKLGLVEDHFIVVPNTVTQSFIKDYKVIPEIMKRYSDDFMVLYIGETGTRRGVKTVIDAAVDLREKIPGLKFVFIGKSKEDREIIAYARQKGVMDLVDFEGWKEPSLFQSYILASKVCISPLLRNTHHDTTYANKVFQYLSMGRPVVASDCPAQENLVKAVRCGLVHQAGNPDDLAGKILALYQDKEMREQYGLNGKRFIESEFTWDKTAAAMVSLYKKLGKGQSDQSNKILIENG